MMITLILKKNTAIPAAKAVDLLLDVFSFGRGAGKAAFEWLNEDLIVGEFITEGAAQHAIQRAKEIDSRFEFDIKRS